MATIAANAQADRYCMTWQDAKDRVRNLLHSLPHSKTSVARIYGIPRGGNFVAAMLVGEPGIALVSAPEEADFFVDDIIDSGRTAARYKEQYGKQTLALINREHEKIKGWVVFPWDDPSDSGPEDGVVRILESIGEDPNRDGLRDTPKRVAKAMREMTCGYAMDPVAILGRTFDIGCDEMVALSGIRFASLCEHHMLPFTGEATIAYIPGHRVVGISKLARVLEAYSKRLQVQERLTSQVADAIEEALQPRGIGVLLRAHHSCIGCRGANQPDAEMITSALRGRIKEDASARAEFLALARKQ